MPETAVMVTILIRLRLAVESAEDQCVFLPQCGTLRRRIWGQSVPLHSECLRVDTVSFDIEIDNDLVAVIFNGDPSIQFGTII